MTMKNILILACLFIAGIATAQTTADKAVRDSLFADPDFQSLVGDFTYNVALDIVSDTTAYSISVRPFFDRYLTAPANTRDYFTEMIARATLNNSQTVINLASVASDTEYIIKTLGIWQGPVNAYIRQRENTYAFPYDISALQATISALEARVLALENP